MSKVETASLVTRVLSTSSSISRLQSVTERQNVELELEQQGSRTQENTTRDSALVYSMVHTVVSQCIILDLVTAFMFYRCYDFRSII